METLKHQLITERVIGCAFQVHQFLGNGYQENIYQRALALELQSAGVNFNREASVDIYYKDYQRPIGTRRSDFLIENTVLVELKALTKLEGVHLAQMLGYLKAYRLEVGLIINFGSRSLEFKRVVSTKDHSQRTVDH